MRTGRRASVALVVAHILQSSRPPSALLGVDSRAGRPHRTCPRGARSSLRGVADAPCGHLTRGVARLSSPYSAPERVLPRTPLLLDWSIAVADRTLSPSVSYSPRVVRCPRRRCSSRRRVRGLIDRSARRRLHIGVSPPPSPSILVRRGPPALAFCCAGAACSNSPAVARFMKSRSGIEIPESSNVRSMRPPGINFSAPVHPTPLRGSKSVCSCEGVQNVEARENRDGPRRDLAGMRRGRRTGHGGCCG
jgi:hypothetical protein